MNSQPLHTLLNLARRGDREVQNQAYGDLVRLITIFVRVGMGERLRNLRESIDVSQSIAKSFLVDHRAGDLDFPSESALVAYLKSVVQSKLARLARHDQASKRGGPGRNANHPADEPSQTVSLADVSQEAAVHDAQDNRLRSQEALALIHSHFDQRDQTIARLRLAGESWDSIATQLGEDPVTLRKHWSRLATDLAREFDLER